MSDYAVCDRCGCEAIGCLGGEAYYCAEHEDDVVNDHAEASDDG